MNDRDPRPVDLHTHTNFSDGVPTPEELAALAAKRCLRAIALTDHDTVAGWPRFEAACAAEGVEFVPGVELSCEWEGREVHIVGLYVEPDARFRERIDYIREKREHRMDEMLEKLRGLGFDITLEDLGVRPGQSFARPHLGRALVTKKIVRSLDEAFARYIGDHGPAYVAKTRLPAEEAVAMVHRVRGVAILAHPGVSRLMDHLDHFAGIGIDGVEADYPKHTPATREAIRDFCESRGLLQSGGSDYHGNQEGPVLGEPPVDYARLEAIRARKEQLWRSASSAG